MKHSLLRLLLVFCLALPVSFACSKSDKTPSEQNAEQSFPEHEGYRIYAVDETGWDALYVYMYGTVNDLGGKWPGIKTGGKLTVNKQQYVYFDLPVEGAYGATEKLIFNNGSGKQISKEPSLNFGEKADYFFTVTADGATAFNGGSEWTVTVDNGPIKAEASKISEIAAAERNAWRIYQVNPKLYGSSGAFTKIQARLDDIAALGTDVLYLMPVYKEGKKNAIGSPYCISDFTALNDAYGTLEELQALVNAAHEKGMKVIFDWVANHTAWDHPWISAHKDWYKQDASGNIVCPTADGTWSDVAQLNHANAALRAEMTAALQHWVTTLGIDGYRCDYAHGPTGRNVGDMDTFWKEAIAALRAQHPDLIMLAESDFTKMFDDGFDIIFSRASKSRLVSVFGGSSPSNFFSAYKSAINAAPAPKTVLLYVTNHDDATEASPVSEFRSKEGALAAFILMRALNTSTMIYGSQEVGYGSTINFFKTSTFSWTAEADYFAAYKKTMTALTHIDRNQDATVYAAGPLVLLAYPDALVAVNTSERDVEATLPAALVGQIYGDEITGSGVTLSATLPVKAYEYRILVKN